MNEQQKANLLNHAAFLDRVVTVDSGNGLTMAVFYKDLPYSAKGGAADAISEEPAEAFDLADLTKVEGGDCNFCACAIGWSVANPDLPKPTNEEDWDEYSRRVFGTDVWSHGSYAFSPALDTEEGSVVAERIRKMVAAYPTALVIEREMYNGNKCSDRQRTYEGYIKLALEGYFSDEVKYAVQQQENGNA